MLKRWAGSYALALSILPSHPSRRLSKLHGYLRPCTTTCGAYSVRLVSTLVGLQREERRASPWMRVHIHAAIFMIDDRVSADGHCRCQQPACFPPRIVCNWSGLLVSNTARGAAHVGRMPHTTRRHSCLIKAKFIGGNPGNKLVE